MTVVIVPNALRLTADADIGSVTILFSQPVSGLQILDRQGQWKWVRHIDNALVSLALPPIFLDCFNMWNRS